MCICLALIDMLFPAAVGVQPAAVVIEDKERSCDSLLMCIVTVLSHGLRSGGGVGDVLRKPSKEVPRLKSISFFYSAYGRRGSVRKTTIFPVALCVITHFTFSIITNAVMISDWCILNSQSNTF